MLTLALVLAALQQPAATPPPTPAPALPPQVGDTSPFRGPARPEPSRSRVGVGSASRRKGDVSPTCGGRAGAGVGGGVAAGCCSAARTNARVSINALPVSLHSGNRPRLRPPPCTTRASPAR